jgi:hypothetical protein
LLNPELRAPPATAASRRFACHCVLFCSRVWLLFPQMCVGERRKIVIPSGKGYGASGSGAKIPGGATLVFDVELMSIA